MKYTIVSPETETTLAIVESIESKEGASWTITPVNLPVSSKEADAQKTTLSGVAIEITNGNLVLRLSKGQRKVFPISKRLSDGSVIVATALGNIKLLASRGVSADAVGSGAQSHRPIKSQMPGKILKVLCKTGDQIEAGQPLLIIEAMKMENEIRAPLAGVVEEVAVEVGKKVETGELLVKLGTGV